MTFTHNENQKPSEVFYPAFDAVIKLAQDDKRAFPETEDDAWRNEHDFNEKATMLYNMARHLGKMRVEDDQAREMFWAIIDDLDVLSNEYTDMADAQDGIYKLNAEESMYEAEMRAEWSSPEATGRI